MKNFMVSKALFKNFIYSGTVPTSDDLDIMTSVVDDKEDKEKVMYILGLLTEYTFEKNAVKNTQEYYSEFLTNLFDKFDKSEANIEDIAKLVYIAQELTNTYTLNEVKDIDEKIEYFLSILSKADEIYEGDDYYFVVLFRVSSIFMSLSLEDFKKYSDISAQCSALYIKYYKSVYASYKEVIRT